MNITYNFYRRFYLLDNYWLCTKNLGALIRELNNMFFLKWKFSSWFHILAILGFEQCFQKHLTKSFIWILFDLYIMFLVWIKSFRLFGKFVNRNLSDNQREVFSFVYLLLVWLSGNICLVCKFEVSFHVVEPLIIFLDSIFGLVFITVILFRFNFWRKIVMIHKKLLGIDFTYFLKRNVWSLVFKSSMNKNIVIWCPASMSKSLNRTKFKPFWRLGIIYF